MKIAVPVANIDDYKSNIYGHFGSSPYYAIIEFETEKLEFIDNSSKDHIHGQCQPVNELVEKKVEAVVCNGMGRRAIDNLNSIGIKVYFIPEATTLEEIIDSFKKGNLKEFSQENACKHNNICE